MYALTGYRPHAKRTNLRESPYSPKPVHRHVLYQVDRGPLTLHPFTTIYRQKLLPGTSFCAQPLSVVLLGFPLGVVFGQLAVHVIQGVHIFLQGCKAPRCVLALICQDLHMWVSCLALWCWLGSWWPWGHCSSAPGPPSAFSAWRSFAARCQEICGRPPWTCWPVPKQGLRTLHACHTIPRVNRSRYTQLCKDR